MFHSEERSWKYHRNWSLTSVQLKLLRSDPRKTWVIIDQPLLATVGIADIPVVEDRNYWLTNIGIAIPSWVSRSRGFTMPLPAEWRAAAKVSSLRWITKDWRTEENNLWWWTLEPVVTLKLLILPAPWFALKRTDQPLPSNREGLSVLEI